MIRIDILSATPELLESPFSGSILRRAIEKERTTHRRIELT